MSKDNLKFYEEEPYVSNERNITEEMKIQEERIVKEINRRKKEQLENARNNKFTDKIVPIDEVTNMDNGFLTFRESYLLNDNQTKISKTDIILRSPYRIYYEEETLEDKHLVFLFFYDMFDGHVGESCKRMGITRHTYSRWRDRNSVFNEIISDNTEYLIDSAENAVKTAIKEGDFNAAKFVLESKGKSRGYGKQALVQTEDITEVVGFEFINVNDEVEDVEVIEHKEK